MGKGDRKSRRGKIFMGSYGKTRPRKWKTFAVAAGVTASIPVVETAEDKKKTAKKKPAATAKKKKQEE